MMLADRAAARGMASGTYVSVLVRSHLRRIVPIPNDEMAALKKAIAELTSIGRNLNQIARANHQGRAITPDARTYPRARVQSVFVIWRRSRIF